MAVIPQNLVSHRIHRFFFSLILQCNLALIGQLRAVCSSQSINCLDLALIKNEQLNIRKKPPFASLVDDKVPKTCDVICINTNKIRSVKCAWLLPENGALQQGKEDICFSVNF